MAIELDIIRLYDRNLRSVYTIRQVATLLDSAYPYVHRTVHKLLDLGVLTTVRVGSTHCLSLNLKNRRAILYLTELELEKRAKLPEAMQALAKRLDRDGTLAIETAIYGADGVIIVGSGNYSGAHVVAPEAFVQLLLSTDLFTTHTVLTGYERFFAYLASIQQDLDSRYNPLLQVKP